MQLHALDATADIGLNVVATRLPQHSGHDWNLDITVNTRRRFTFSTLPFRDIPASWIMENARSSASLMPRSPAHLRGWHPSAVNARVLDASGRVLWDSAVSGVSPKWADLQPQTWPPTVGREQPDIVVPSGAARIVVTTNRFFLTDEPAVPRRPLTVSIGLGN